MFEEILGIPAHPLLVHAAVVFVPLQVAAALVYALVPLARRYIAWFVVGVAVVAPFTVLFAKLSGEALQERLIRNKTISPEISEKVVVHSGFGANLLYASIVLGVVMLALVYVQNSRSRPRDTDDNAEPPSRGSMILAVALTVVTVLAAGASGYYVFQTGDTGGHMVWTGI